jgi:hypothetical protein
MLFVWTLMVAFLMVGNATAAVAYTEADTVFALAPATNRPVNPGITLPFVTGVVGSVGKVVKPPA